MAPLGSIKMSATDRQIIKRLLLFLSVVFLFLYSIRRRKNFLVINSQTLEGRWKGVPSVLHSEASVSTIVKQLEEELPYLLPFRRYTGPATGADKRYSHSVIPTWVVTPANSSCIHRFFDTSPFSPSGRYLGLTCLKKGAVSEERDIQPLAPADIVIVDLLLGTQRIVYESRGWDSQTGAHVQWGRNDRELYFNDVVNGSVVASISLNIFTNTTRVMSCPVYQVSPDGSKAISPDLTKIKFTQSGYGVHLRDASKNHDAPEDDGIYITDLKKNTCRLLVSLKELVDRIPNKLIQKCNRRRSSSGSTFTYPPTYGFHTKWSSDGKMIMFVVRTLETLSGGIQKTVSQLMDDYHKVRRQHLFTMLVDGSDVKYIQSWSSDKYVPLMCDGKNGTMNPDNQRDGNHPNWIPGTHKISMNIEVVKRRKSSNELEIINDIILTKQWSVNIWDADYNFTDNKFRNTVAYDKGSGHPNFGLGGRYAILDVYPKERKFFNHLEDFSVPIRLVDTVENKEVWLMQLQTERSHGSSWGSITGISDLYGARSRNAWRCDPHVAFDKSFQVG